MSLQPSQLLVPNQQQALVARTMSINSGSGNSYQSFLEGFVSPFHNSILSGDGSVMPSNKQLKAHLKDQINSIRKKQISDLQEESDIKIV